MFNKILGYILLSAGLLIIGATLWQSFWIFTGKASAPLLFQTPASIDFPGASVIPPASITKFFNLSAWLMLAFILLGAGGAMARIGVKLINGK